MAARLSQGYSQWLGLFPGRVDDRGARPELIWRDMRQTRLIDPFFEDSFTKAVGPQRRSGWEAISEVARVCESIAPTGFIFHMSRCGSTLVARMLAASSSNIVLSEVPTIDAVLRAQAWDPGIDDDTKVERLRHLVAVLGQRCSDDQKRLFVKFDAWSVMELPLILRAFPEVPWLFLYRDPVEVLVSHLRRPGMHMVPGLLKGAPFDSAPANSRYEDYGPWLLAQVCQAALDYREHGRGRLVDYSWLPRFVTRELPVHFGIDLSASERDQMEAAASYDAKTPMVRFENDTDRKQAAATTQLRELVARWFGELWPALREVDSGAGTNGRNTAASR